MDRYWLITWTTYGTWRPGDERGFVGRILDEETGTHRIENRPQTPYFQDIRELKTYSNSQLKSKPIYLVEDQAKAMAEQFLETAQYRGWKLLAFAIMRNHVHLVVGVNGDPEPEDIMRDFKSYASRRLNRTWSKPESGTWWTESASVRKLRNEKAIYAAVEYVRNQEYPLVLEVDEGWVLTREWS